MGISQHIDRRFKIKHNPLMRFQTLQAIECLHERSLKGIALSACFHNVFKWLAQNKTWIDKFYLMALSQRENRTSSRRFFLLQSHIQHKIQFYVIDSN